MWLEFKMGDGRRDLIVLLGFARMRIGVASGVRGAFVVTFGTSINEFTFGSILLVIDRSESMSRLTPSRFRCGA